MKISYNWLKDYLKTDLPASTISEMLTATGLEVEGLEAHEQIKGGLKGVVTGHVLTCEKHPEADRLSITTVDVGGEVPLDIVCGAPNVQSGQMVFVATVGTTLHMSENQVLEIKKAKIRGATSEGMICAEDELGIGESHAGIMILPEDTTVGLPAADVIGLYNDEVFEIGLTPNRSDANGHIGVARDLVAVLKTHHQWSGQLNYPDISAFPIESGEAPISVEIENSTACPRYSGIYIKNIRVGASPEWLKNRLEAIGQRPINNVVDITNYILHEFGQPLHAFDAHKIKGQKIVVKCLPAGTKFRTLDETERELHGEDLMICNGDGEGMCIAGVFGGIESGVKNETTDIFLESAHFQQGYIRRTSGRHQLRTDAARCFEKGTDPNGTVTALKRAALLITELCGGEIAGPLVDVYPEPVARKEVQTTVSYINRLSGVDLTADQIKAILESLEIELKVNGDELKVWVPTNKPDVTRPADIVEEVLRIYGLDNVPIHQHMRSALTHSEKPDPVKIKEMVANHLAATGFHEMMALSITQSEHFRKAIPVADEELVYINNTSNIQYDVMRADMLISGLEAILHNLNRKQNDLKLFEFGYSYRHKEGKYQETEQLCVYVSGKKQESSWHISKSAPVNYYTIKSVVSALFERLGIKQFQTAELEDSRWSYGLQYSRGESVLVQFGKLNKKVLEAMDIKQEVYAASFNWQAMWQAFRQNRTTIQAISRFPEVRRDLALIINKEITFAECEKVARKTEKELLRQVQLFDVYVSDELKAKGKKSYALSFLMEPADKTLSEKEIESIMDRLINAYEKQLGAEIRK
jgi:phenylalanyl-tRNA synthetase beta chain